MYGPYSTNDYVASILRTFDAATDDEFAAGMDWYPSMTRTIAEHATGSTLSMHAIAGIFAATSINTPWKRNVALATMAIENGRLDGGTLGMVIAKVNAILSGVDVDTALQGDKVRSFARNLSGDYDAVTVDRWAHRVATNGAESSVPTGKRYEAIAAAYRIAAAQRGVTPAAMQAITWTVARGTAD